MHPWSIRLLSSADPSTIVNASATQKSYSGRYAPSPAWDERIDPCSTVLDITVRILLSLLHCIWVSRGCAPRMSAFEYVLLIMCDHLLNTLEAWYCIPFSLVLNACSLKLNAEDGQEVDVQAAAAKRQALNEGSAAVVAARAASAAAAAAAQLKTHEILRCDLCQVGMRQPGSSTCTTPASLCATFTHAELQPIASSHRPWCPPAPACTLLAPLISPPTPLPPPCRPPSPARLCTSSTWMAQCTRRPWPRHRRRH